MGSDDRRVPTEPAVGSPIERVDAEAKVTGRAAYVEDIETPGMLHAALVFPGCASGRLIGVDPSPALAIPGVHAVLTARDIPGENQIGVVESDQPLLPDETIRYSGDAVAIVAADSAQLAREAARAVVVEIEELPAVFDAVEAMRDGAPRVHEDGNVLLHYKVRRGDTGPALEAAHAVVERTFTAGNQEHAYLETQGALAVPEGDQGITIHGSMQCPYYVQRSVATVLGVPLAAVRVLQAVTGGGFGGKEDIPSETAACAAVAAWKTGRPVRLVYSREEDFLRSSKRHPMRVTYRLGAAEDGTFTAAEVRIIADCGAYATLSPIVLFRSIAHAAGPYEIPNVTADAYGVYTNRQTSGAFRGFGQPQPIFAGESVVDEMAAKLGIDPVELRLRNCLAEGRRTATGQLLDESVGLPETLRRARDASGWEEKRRSSGRDTGRVRRGIGAASIYYGVSLGAKGAALDSAGARVNLYRDGSLRIDVGNTEMGQGLMTVLCQIAADGLGVDASVVRIDLADTSILPDCGPTVASRGSLMSGNAIIDATKKLKKKIAGVAAEMLDAPEGALAFEGGRVAGGGRSISFAQLAEECWVRNVDTAADGWYAAPATSFDENGQGDAYAVYSYATHIAEVEVDTETGKVHVAKITAAHDVGRILNPVTLEGQIQGGVVQGIGYALFEEMKTDGGAITTPDFSTYVIPTSMDVPEIEAIFVEEPYSRGPFGAKGIGETPLMPVAAAVANAVANATGHRPTRLPLTAESLALALRRKET